MINKCDWGDGYYLWKIKSYCEMGQLFTALCPPPDAPTTTIFPRDDVKVGTENTLICHVTGVFPPRLNVTWNKNNMAVTERVSASQLRKNRDGTFNQFFTLKFTPKEGDIYTCTVEHQALERPTTREWGETSVYFQVY